MTVIHRRPAPAPAPPPSGPADGAVRRIAARAAAVTLDEVLARAALQVRQDRKYLVPARELRRVAAMLGRELEVLEIDGLRSFAYASRYFDTPGRLTYRDHLDGRADRFKVRTRSYLDSAETMFEVKLATPDGGTVKRRAGHPFGARDRMTAAAGRHLAAALREAGRAVPAALAPASLITYRRSTFVLRDGSARITCDRDMTVREGGRRATGLAGHILVEVKSAEPAGPVDRALEALGMAPASVSKYCVGVALMDPAMPCDPWEAVLERGFGRAPDRAAA
jgi:hypothetical protein